MVSSDIIRKRFLDYWKSAPRNHAEAPNVSLVPNVDSTLLFVNSGMFPLAPYLGGEVHPLGKRLVNLQRCLRTKADEVEEIGDNRHTLMFEMMGNWSLGDYFKEEQIPWMLELYVNQFELDPHRLYVSVWAGDNKAPRDLEAIEMWKKAFAKYGIQAEFSEDITQIPQDLEASKQHNVRIFPYNKENWWERAHAPGELGGPTTEIFYDLGQIEREQDQYHINDDSGRFIEIGNSVFMQYRLDNNMDWQKLAQQNVDFGGGFERAVMCAQGKQDIFETDIFLPVIEKIVKLTGKEYKTDGKVNQYTRAFRILADHGRIVTFLIADGVIPANKDQGYILRRFIRRLVRFGKVLEIDQNFTGIVAQAFIDRMQQAYPHLKEQEDHILQTLHKEEEQFRKTLNKGLKELEKLRDSFVQDAHDGKLDSHPATIVDGKSAFYLYETYGFPLEMTLEEMGINADSSEAKHITDQFNAEQRLHQEQSRAGAQQKFTGGLADHSDQVVKLHSTHHILLRALQIVLGEHVKQRGSNITGERLRIDFSHKDKLTDQELLQVEGLVNKVIQTGYAMFPVIMHKDDALQLGAEMEFGQKYPETVKVYLMYDADELSGSIEKAIAKLNPTWDKQIGGTGSTGTTPITVDADLIKLIQQDVFSMEFCGGPHVQNTSEIGSGAKSFKIQKQESSGAGIRRLKATIE